MKHKRKKIVGDILFNQDHDEEHKKVLSPQVLGETSMEGSMPDPESDDDVLANAHNMGLYEESDYEHPKEVGLGEEVDKDEQYHRTHS